MHKKLLICASFLLFATQCKSAHQPDHEAGKAKIKSIMAHEETGISAYNKKNIHCAETQNLAHDINIDAIASFYDCATIMGNEFLIETLRNPVAPEDKNTILANRQDAIRVLVEDSAFKKEISELLKEARLAEQETIILLSEFFKGKTCPELKNLELIRQQNPALAPLIEFITVNQTMKELALSVNVVSLGGMLFMLRKMSPVLYQLIKNGNYTGQAIGMSAYFTLLGCLNGYALYKDYSVASEKRSKIYSLNRLVHIAEKIEALCNKHGIKKQFNISNINDSKGKQLVQKLKHTRYADKSCVFFATPAVHAFLYQIYQQEQYLTEVLSSIAEMDAYHAFATKILASQTSDHKMCFVSFLDDEKPQVHIKGFWNVLVQNAIVNDLNENKHIILTGPNAGGKTTCIKAILQNIVLGQSFGVAAAETCEFTMFDVIYSYLNISDDLLHGLSLFASEIKRAQEIIETIKALEPNKKFFFALDELFTGTAAAEGEICAYNFIQRVAASQGVQFIYATHFNKVTELSATNNHCTNYQVDAPTKNGQGKLVYPFTLSKGASESHVALALAKEANLFA